MEGSFIMNDELMTAARDCFSGIQMGVPEEQIISRGRVLRARRRRSRLAAGAMAGLAAGAIAVNALLPASQPGTSTGNVRLEAWTIQKEANGSVHTRLLSGPAEMAALRADIVPPPSGIFNTPTPTRRCRAFAQRLEGRGVQMFLILAGPTPGRHHPGHGKGDLGLTFPPGAKTVIFEWRGSSPPFPVALLKQAARACEYPRPAQAPGRP
jgi:hypothetical protein